MQQPKDKDAMLSDDDKVPYQWVLRSIGAYLDERQASDLCVLEGPNGFEVMYRGAGQEQQVIHFPHQELSELRAKLEEHRRRKGQDGVGSYQDLLRAVGHDLEQASAYDVLLKEVDGKMIVTYQFLNPATGYLWHKRLAIMEPDDLHLVVQQAHARRVPDRRGGLLGLLSS